MRKQALGISIAAVVAITGSFLSGPAAFAGSLTMIGTAKLGAVMKDDEIVISGTYEIDNKGDESAFDVFPGLELDKWSWVGKPARIDAGGKQEWPVSEKIKISVLDKELPSQGRLSILTRRYYKDINGYAFSAADVTTFYVGVFTPEQQVAMQVPDLQLQEEVGGDGQNFTGKISARNLGKESLKARITIFTAREIGREEQEPRWLEVPVGKTVDIRFHLMNVTGLVGSTYAVYGIAEWQHGGIRLSATSSAVASIHRVEMIQRYLVAAALILIVMGLIIYWKVFR
jgi:hypothetical protein